MKTWTFFVGLLISSVSFYSFSQNYSLEQVIVEPYADSINRTGKLAFKRTLNLSFKSAGYLTELSVDEGEYFEKGQLLASLDTTELLEEKNTRYAQLLQAKREVNRQKVLIDKGLSSEQELDVAETRVETTRAAYSIAYYNLEKAQIISPFSGVVLNRNTELGELQSPGQEVLQVASLDKNWVVKVALTGSEVSQVRLNQNVEVTLQSVGKVKGTVSKIPAISNTQGNLFLIEVLLPELNLRSGIIAGQIADVTIDFTSDNFVYRLPIAALVSVDEQGKAVVITQNAQELSYQSFDIFRLDNQFVYLFASVHDQPLQIVTQGWQHLSLGTK